MEPMADASTYEKRILQRAWRNKLPVNGSIELLPLCNMDCDMCYVRLSREEMERRGRIRSAAEWLALGEEMQQAGVIFLLLTGGEPLLHPEFREIYLGLQRLGMVLTINSNGTMIDEEWASFFAEYPPRRINITLYGTDNETYEKLCHYKNGFDKTMRGIRLLKETHVDVRVGCSVIRLNYHELDCFFDICRELDVYSIADTYMAAATRERERDFAFDVRLSPEDAAACRLKVLRNILGKERWPAYVQNIIFEVEHIVPEDSCGSVICYAGNCSFAISWLGEMRPCVTLSTPAFNVFDLGIQKAWEQLTAEVAQIRTGRKCNLCRYRTFCQNCAGNALIETGSTEGAPEYLCRFSEETYRLYKKEAEEFLNE